MVDSKEEYNFDLGVKGLILFTALYLTYQHLHFLEAAVMQGECSLILILVQPLVTSVSQSHALVHSGSSQFCSPSIKYQIHSINIHIMYFIKFFYNKV